MLGVRPPWRPSDGELGTIRHHLLSCVRAACATGGEREPVALLLRIETTADRGVWRHLPAEDLESAAADVRGHLAQLRRLQGIGVYRRA